LKFLSKEFLIDKMEEDSATTLKYIQGPKPDNDSDEDLSDEDENMNIEQDVMTEIEKESKGIQDAHITSLI
jgi:hypothetical protein